MQERLQQELAETQVEATAGGGMVTVTANGKKELTAIKIDPEILTEDTEMVEDLILVAVNQALENAQEQADEKIKSVTGGMLGWLNIPGL